MQQPLPLFSSDKEMLLDDSATMPSLASEAKEVSGRPFAPSAYQEAILRHQETGDGDGFVDAVAGSGKTTILTQLATRLSEEVQRKSAFVAFNRHIVGELKARLPAGFTVKTIHALGYAALRARHKFISDPVDENKYRIFAKKIVLDAPDDREWEDHDMVDALCRATSLARLTLCDVDAAPAGSEDDPLLLLCERYGVEVLDSQMMAHGVRRMLASGRALAPTSIDLDDMVWLPATDPTIQPWQYERLYVDECQDLNPAQREFLLKVKSYSARAYWVGDERQAIYAFAGADVGALLRLSERTYASKLPLSICYRCPSSHLDLARQIVPHIEARPDAPQGRIENASYEKLPSMLPDGALVLCRINLPTLELAFNLISAGRPAYVKGRDIGKSLTVLMDNAEKIGGKRVEKAFADFEKRLEEYCTKKMTLLRRKEGQERALQGLQDRWQCVALLYQQGVTQGVQSVEELKAFCEDIFQENGKGIILSTVHKAKGLEADSVWLLHPELMPHPMARRDEERLQEMNLKYVALTRSKSDLFFITR